MAYCSFYSPKCGWNMFSPVFLLQYKSHLYYNKCRMLCSTPQVQNICLIQYEQWSALQTFPDYIIVFLFSPTLGMWSLLTHWHATKCKCRFHIITLFLIFLEGEYDLYNDGEPLNAGWCKILILYIKLSCITLCIKF